MIALAGIERAALPALAGYASWLSLLWLAVAVVELRPGWFTAFQAALSAAALFGVAAWLDWTATGPFEFTDPDNLRRFLLGLSVLALTWTLLRLVLGQRTVLDSPWPAFDGVALAGLVTGQMILAVLGVVPGMLHEMGPTVGGFGEGVSQTWNQAVDPAAWWLLAVLNAALAGGLWVDGPTIRRGAILLGLLAVAVTAAVLAAGWFAPALATASALRWALAVVFLLASLPFWARTTIGHFAQMVGVPVGLGIADRRVLRALSWLPWRSRPSS